MWNSWKRTSGSSGKYILLSVAVYMQCCFDDPVAFCFRPGSTKRRQYYDKQLAPELTHCLPHLEKQFYLYWIQMTLTCPLPDEQNTRGRRLHPPEMASQCFGILIGNEIPPMPPFPIYTRCGEVQIQLVRLVKFFSVTRVSLHDLYFKFSV